MNLVSMKRTPEEAKEYATGELAPGDAPQYPYGLCLCLDDEMLKKLGITELPKVGSELMVMAKAKVMSVRSSQQVDGDEEKGTELQITDMALSAPVKEIDPAAIYDGK